jgi:hypothetical protein
MSRGDRHPDAIRAPTREAPGVARLTRSAGVRGGGAGGAEVEVEEEVEEVELPLPLDAGRTCPK